MRERGLWDDDNPVLPWSYRKMPRNKHKLIGGYSSQQETTPARMRGEQDVIFRGNVKSYRFHRPDCSSYPCKNCTREFTSIEEAMGFGYEACKICLP